MREKAHFKSPKVPRKRHPIFKRAWNLISLSIPIHKLSKPFGRNLLPFRKNRNYNNRKRLRHYNYAFIEEYQFSPSSTPLFQHYGTASKKRDFYSRFLLCRCSGSSTAEEENEEEEVEANNELGSPEIVEGVQGQPESEESESEEGDSVDRRADNFIARFYEEIRIQRQESVLQYTDMLDRGCN